MRRPMALRKCSIKISVFFTSDEYTSDPTIGQNGTCSHWTNPSDPSQEPPDQKKERNSIVTNGTRARANEINITATPDTQTE